MPTALVTGASGFTGRYVVKALQKKGFRVIGWGTGPTDADESETCDLTDAAAVQAAVSYAQPDWVVHLAALSYVGHADQEAFYRTNVFGTLNLLGALANLDTPPSRVLVASSANVYGTTGLEVIGETVCPAPVNHYACSKLAMEHMVANYFDRLPIVITRPFNYTGPGQDERFLIPKIVKHFAKGEPVIELGNIDVSRDFTDVRDLVDAYLALLESESHSERVNIGSGSAMPLRYLVETMNELAGYEIEVRVNPDFVRPNEIPRLQGDNRRLRTLTPWQPRIPLRETLADMLAHEQGAMG